MRDFARRTLKKASAVVVLHEYHAELFSRLCPGLTNIRVVPNFLEAKLMSGLIDEPIHPPGDILKLFFISRVGKEKGVMDSIEAVRILRDRGTDVKLKIGGKGDDLDDARKLADTYGLNDHVEFMGFLAGEEKIEAYRSSDVLLFPTHLCEGFPYVLLEGMAAGTPIITTALGVIPHLLKDGVNGLLIEPRNPERLAEKIEELSRNPQLGTEMAENNRRMLKESYSIDQAEKVYGELYCELLGTGRYGPSET
jgi:glycosyltransferase involved in cell wall biosynthesis